MIPCKVQCQTGKWVGGYYYLESLVYPEETPIAVVVDEKRFLYHRYLAAVQLDMSYLEDDDVAF